MKESEIVQKRIKKLLSIMTIEEKVAQLGSIWIYEVLDSKGFSSSKAAKIINNGIGQITRLGGASNLTLLESAKVANQIQKYLLNNTRHGIPAIIHEEAGNGYMAKGATCFPQTIGIASTWEPDLVEEMSSIIREQLRSVGVHQALAPVLDITRDPRWGRVEETFGEDPYLVSEMGIAYIEGIQGDNWKHGVMATGKHFVGYGVTEGGMNWAPAHIPSREMFEVFITPFEAAIKEAKIAAIMPGYHELDGIPCHSSIELLKSILRDKLNFKGLVVSDYFGINMLHEYHNIAVNKKHAAKLALEAGVDMEFPSTSSYGESLQVAIKEGLINESIIDYSLEKILRIKFQLGLFENPYVDEKKVTYIFNNPKQGKLAYEITQKSIILLKNENNILPINKDTSSIGIIGPNANSKRNFLGDYSYPCHIESLIDMKKNNRIFNTPIPEKIEIFDGPIEIPTILDSIKMKVSRDTIIRYTRGCDVIGNDRSDFKNAIEIAKKSEIVIMVMGGKSGLIQDCTCGESRDRVSLDLTGVQEELIKVVYETGTPVIVVLINGRPLSINWINLNIPAIVEAWLPGEFGGKAIADVIFGDYNPGGKTPISFPRSVGQIPIYYNHKPSGGRTHWRGDYLEMSCKPLFPFGYGLSYTEFRYENLVIKPKKISIEKLLEISFEIINCGPCTGEEVVQLYINDIESEITRPVKELKGFKRIKLEPNQRRTITFILSPKQLGFYNEKMDFVIEPGKMKIMIGSSSEDIRLTGEFEIKGKAKNIQDCKKYFTEIKIK